MRQSFLFLGAAILLGGLVGLFPKVLPLNPGSIVFARSATAAAAAVVLVRLRKQGTLPVRGKPAAMLLLLGGVLGLHWVTYFLAIRVSSVAVGMISLFTFPIMIVFLEPIFLHTQRTKADLGLSLMVFIGVLIMVPEYNLSNNITLGIVWGLISALLYSLRTIFSRKYLQQVDGLTLMVYQFTGAAMVTAPMLSVGSASIGLRDVILLILLGLVFTALAHTLLVLSLEKLKAKTYGIIAASQPFLGTIAAAVFLGEDPSERTLIGGLIVVCAAVYEGYRSLHEDEAL